MKRFFTGLEPYEDKYGVANVNHEYVSLKFLDSLAFLPASL